MHHFLYGRYLSTTGVSIVFARYGLMVSMKYDLKAEIYYITSCERI